MLPESNTPRLTTVSEEAKNTSSAKQTRRRQKKGEKGLFCITLRLSREEWEQVHQIARREGCSLNSLAISRILNSEKNGNSGGQGPFNHQNVALHQDASSLKSSSEEGAFLPHSHETVDERTEAAFAIRASETVTDPETFPLISSLDAPPYTLAEALEELFLSAEEFQDIIEQWRAKKNIILQGPPGVGKTYIAKRLAYYLIGSKTPEQLKMIQFHQSYAYEDFIQGFRPTESGGFRRKNGDCSNDVESPGT